MTQLAPTVGMTQLGGMFGLLKPLEAKGGNDEIEGAQRQLMSFAESLGLSPEELTPEMIVMLQQWLWGGVDLPEAANILQPGATDLPVAPKFAQLLSQSMAADPEPETPARVLFGSGENEATGFERTRLAESVLAALSRGAGESRVPVLPASTPTGVAAKEASICLSGLEALALRPGAPSSITPQMSNALLSMKVPQQVGSGGWDRAIGERLVWMVKGDRQMAELKITPPNLGPLEVKLTVNNDQASVTFLSNHAQVRDALEAAIPRLREMMQQESLQLVDVDVGSQERGEAQTGRGGGAGQTGHVLGETSGESAGDSVRSASTGSAHGIGLVDLFV